MNINEIFDKLNCHIDFSIQQEGVEEAKKIKYISILIMPIDTQDIWENCAKALASMMDEQIMEYTVYLLRWLQNSSWPGYKIIKNRLKELPPEYLYKYCYSQLKQAKREKNQGWHLELLEFILEDSVYTLLSEDQRAFVNMCEQRGG